MAVFCLVVGSLYDLTDVSMTFTITAADGWQLSAEAQDNDRSVPVTPAGGATLDRYKAEGSRPERVRAFVWSRKGPSQLIGQ